MLEKYYTTEYQKRQFAIERNYHYNPDLRITDGIVPEGKKILSVGCGSGRDLRFLVDKNDVHGVDIMPEAIDEAKKNGIKALRTTVERGLPYPNEEFDIVVCKEVLEHLFNPKFVMNEIHRVLKNDGYAFVTVPNHFWYWHRLNILLGKGLILFNHAHWNQWDYFHIRFFTFQGFNELIKESGFKAVKFYFPDTLSDIFAPAKLRRFNFLVPRRVCRTLCKWKSNLLCISFCAKIVKDDLERRD